MALLGQGGVEGVAFAVPRVVGATDGVLAGEVGDDPAGAQDGGLAGLDVVRSDLLTDGVALRVGVAGGEGEVDEVEDGEVDAGGDVPRLGLGFLDGAGDGQGLVVEVGDGPRASGAVEVGAGDLHGLAAVARVGAGLTDGGGVGYPEVAGGQCLGCLLYTSPSPRDS